MGLTLNDIWLDYNNIIQSSVVNDDLAVKMQAVNLGNLYLIDRMQDLGYRPEDLLSSVTNVATTISTNKSSLPSDFNKIHTVFIKRGSIHIPLTKQEIVTYHRLIQITGNLFIDTTDTGEPSLVAFQGLTNIFYDKHYAATGTDDVKIIYYKIPATVTAFNRLAISGITGTFQADEQITGDISEDTGTISVVNADSLDLLVGSGAFQATEEITGLTSNATATVSSSVSEKPFEMEWSNQFKYILPTAYAVLYLELIGSSEVAEKSTNLDNMINLLLNTKNTGSMTMRLGSL